MDFQIFLSQIRSTFWFEFDCRGNRNVIFTLRHDFLFSSRSVEILHVQLDFLISKDGLEMHPRD